MATRRKRSARSRASAKRKPRPAPSASWRGHWTKNPDHPLVKWRRKQRMSLKALGARLGVDKSLLSRLEAGQITRPTPSLLRAIEKVTCREVCVGDLI